MMEVFFLKTTLGLVNVAAVEAVLSNPGKGITIVLKSGRELTFNDKRESQNIFRYFSDFSYHTSLDPHRPPPDNSTIFYSKPEGGTDE